MRHDTENSDSKDIQNNLTPHTGEHFDTDHGRQELKNWGRSDKYHPGWMAQNPFTSVTGIEDENEKSFEAQNFGPALGETSPEQSGEYGGLGPMEYRRSPERMKGDIGVALTWNADIDASGIKVMADDRGEVTLTGHVRTLHQKELSEDLASSVRGVTVVHNQLRVQEEMN